MAHDLYFVYSFRLVLSAVIGIKVQVKELHESKYDLAATIS